MTFKPPIPILRSFDEKLARQYYLDYLGFNVDWEHRFHEGAPLYMQISLEDSVLHLSEHYGDATPGSAIRIETDLRPYFKMIKAKQGYGNNPDLLEQTWGMLEMILTDPFGNRLVFCETLPPNEKGA